MEFQPPPLQEVIRHRPLLHCGTGGTTELVERLLWKEKRTGGY